MRRSWTPSKQSQIVFLLLKQHDFRRRNCGCKNEQFFSSWKINEFEKYSFYGGLTPVQYRKWSPTVNDPETANDPQNGPQMILDRKWSLKSTTNDPVKTWGMEWILWEWLQKRTDYKKETFFSRLLKKKGGRTLHLRSIYTRRKKKME